MIIRGKVEEGWEVESRRPILLSCLATTAARKATQALTFTSIRTVSIEIARCAALFVSLLHANHTHSTGPLSTRHLLARPKTQDHGRLFYHPQAITTSTSAPAPPPDPARPLLVKLLGFPPPGSAPVIINHKTCLLRLLPCSHDLPTRRRNLPRLLGRSQSHDGRTTSHPPLAAAPHPRRLATKRMHHFGERQTTRHNDGS